jgi:hypothetical protein
MNSKFLGLLVLILSAYITTQPASADFWKGFAQGMANQLNRQNNDNSYQRERALQRQRELEEREELEARRKRELIFKLNSCDRKRGTWDYNRERCIP